MGGHGKMGGMGEAMSYSHLNFVIRSQQKRTVMNLSMRFPPE